MKQPRAILILCALKRETLAVERALCQSLKKQSPVKAGKKALLESFGIRVRTTGPGPDRIATQLKIELEEMLPDRVYLAGLCGGLHPEHVVGKIVQPQRFVSPQSDNPLELIHSQSAQPLTMLTVNQPLLSSVQKQQAARDYAADVVDMEAYAFVNVCQQREIDCCVIKAVSDDSQTTLPGLCSEIITSSGRINWLKLIWGILKNPGVVKTLLELQRTSHQALQALAEALFAELHCECDRSPQPEA